MFQPGYMGYLDEDEYAFLYKELKKRSGLRKRWFFTEVLTNGDVPKLSEFHIRHVALYGCPHTEECQCTETLKNLKNEEEKWNQTIEK